ncbi:MAG: class I SAM-dependent methyltransferase [Candidatus Hodarchaeota archaeon]
MKINWNFIDLMKRGREIYIKDKKFRDYFKKIFNLKGYEKILDVGCGIGTVPRLIYKIYKNVNQIFGIDIDPNLIKWGQTHWGKPENIHLLCGDVYDLEFPKNEFNIITSFGLLEWLEHPLKALDEMMRVKKEDGRFITLVIEKSKYEKFPIDKEDSYFYKEYLKGVKKMGCPIRNEGDYIQELFSNREINSKRYQYIFEHKIKITERLIELWEGTFTKASYLKFIKSSMDFYFQFLKSVGWKNEEFIKYLKDELSMKKKIDFLKHHLGEDMIQRTTMVILVS